MKTQQILHNQDPEKLQAEYEERLEIIGNLRDQLALYDKPAWMTATQIDTSHMKAEKERLESLNQQYLAATNAAPAAASLHGDQKRINHNHQQRMTKLNEDLEAKKAKKLKVIETRERSSL